MKRKSFLVFLVFLASICMAQSQINTKVYADGIYVFEKAEYSASPYGETAIVETSIVNNIDSLEAYGFPFDHVFREMEISSGQVFVQLGANYAKSLYRMDGNILYLIEGSDKARKKDVKATKNLGKDLYEDLEEDLPETPQTIVLPTLTCTQQGEKLLFTYTFPFGSTRYNFSLEGTTTFTLTKKLDNNE